MIQVHSIPARAVHWFILVAFALEPIFSQAAPSSPQCKGNSKLVGACYVVHGRAAYGPGTPALRIWQIGTKRMLGVTAGPVADDADNPIIPKAMLFGPGKKAFGDFEVCPFTPEHAGAMQMVCVEDVKNLTLR